MVTRTEHAEPDPKVTADIQGASRFPDAASVVRSRAVRIILGFGVAVISDVVSVLAEFMPPAQWITDLATACLLYVMFGRNWLLLPGLIAEAIPGVALFPSWVLVVAAISAGAFGRHQRDHSAEVGGGG